MPDLLTAAANYGRARNCSNDLFQGDAAGGRIAAVLVGLPFAAPFLNPMHIMPLTSFHTERVAFFSDLALVALQLWRARSTPLPGASWWFLALGTYVAAQPLLLGPRMAGVTSISALYILWAACLIWCGASLVSAKAEAVDAMATALVFGGLVNAAATIAQVNYISTAANWILPDFRIDGSASGFLGQNNHFSDYVTLAAVSALYLYESGRIRAHLLWVVLTVFVWALALTSSRSIWLYLTALIVISVLWLRHWRVPLVVAGIFGTILALQYVIGQFQDIATSIARMTDGTGATGDRVRLYLSMRALDVWREHPIFGVGFGQNIVLYEGRISNHTHNIVTQLLAETGLIGSMIAYFALRDWLDRFVAQAFKLENWWIASLLSVLSIHSMVEMPLWYMHFLTIFSLLIGLGYQGDPK